MNKRPLVLALVSILLTLLLGRLDHASTSFADVARLQNVPALVLYSAGFFGMLTMLFGWRRPAAVRIRSRR